MRALLVNPWIYDFKAFDFWNKPIGLLPLASILKKNGFELDLIDCLDRNHPALPIKTRTDPYGRGKYLFEVIEKPALYSEVPRRYKRYGLPRETFINLLNNIKMPDVILVTSSMTYWYLGVFEAISILKDKFPKIPIMLGGVYSSICAEHARKKSGADYVVVGPGERKIVELLTAMNLIQKPIYEEDVMPDYSLYPQLDYIVINTSRGCPFKCTYCAIHNLVPDVHYYKPEKIIEAIRQWTETNLVKNIAFFDDALLTNPHLRTILEQIAQLYREIYLHSSNGLHARYMTGEIARLMKQANFETIYLSLETINEERQKETGNKVITSEFLAAINNLLKYNFKPEQIHVYLMVGLPDQSEEEVIESIDFCKKLKIKINLTEFSPIPGTVEYQRTGLESDADPLFHNNTFYTWFYPEPKIEFLKKVKHRLQE